MKFSKPTVPNPSPEDFVVIWTTSDTLDDVCKATGLTYDAVRQRAKRLRAAGVKLKYMANRRHTTYDPLRIAQLNSLVNKYKSRG